MNQPDPALENCARSRRSSKWIFAGISAAVIALFLWSEHRGHVLGVLPYLLLLACPLMHLFHHGHGHRVPRDGKHSSLKNDK